MYGRDAAFDPATGVLYLVAEYNQETLYQVDQGVQIIGIIRGTCLLIETTNSQLQAAVMGTSRAGRIYFDYDKIPQTKLGDKYFSSNRPILLVPVK